MGRVAQPHPAAARPRHASNAIGALRMKHLFAGIHSLGPPELPNTSNQHCNTGLARTGGRHWEESSPPPRLEIPDHPRHCPYVSGPRHRRTPPHASEPARRCPSRPSRGRVAGGWPSTPVAGASASRRRATAREPGGATPAERWEEVKPPDQTAGGRIRPHAPSG